MYGLHCVLPITGFLAHNKGTVEGPTRRQWWCFIKRQWCVVSSAICWGSSCTNSSTLRGLQKCHILASVMNATNNSRDAGDFAQCLRFQSAFLSSGFAFFFSFFLNLRETSNKLVCSSLNKIFLKTHLNYFTFSISFAFFLIYYTTSFKTETKKTWAGEMRWLSQDSANMRIWSWIPSVQLQSPVWQAALLTPSARKQRQGPLDLMASSVAEPVSFGFSQRLISRIRWRIMRETPRVDLWDTRACVPFPTGTLPCIHTWT